jgi:hypothetical protein
LEEVRVELAGSRGSEKMLIVNRIASIFNKCWRDDLRLLSLSYYLYRERGEPACSRVAAAPRR